MRANRDAHRLSTRARREEGGRNAGVSADQQVRVYVAHFVWAEATRRAHEGAWGNAAATVMIVGTRVQSQRSSVLILIFGV